MSRRKRKAEIVPADQMRARPGDLVQLTDGECYRIDAIVRPDFLRVSRLHDWKFVLASQVAHVVHRNERRVIIGPTNQEGA